MNCKEEIVDMKDPRNFDDSFARKSKLLFDLNHTFGLDEKYKEILNELFEKGIGENSTISSPLQGVCFDRVKIGKDVFINSNCLMMARGGIEIEDGVKIAANAQLITNNHDPYDLSVLTCRKIVIKKGAWIGAGATILPGVCIGRHAIVGAGAVVTRDVPDFAVVVGNPAKIVKTLDKDRFKD